MPGAPAGEWLDMTGLWIVVAVLAVHWVLSVVLKTAFSVPLIKNFEPGHRHLGRDHVKRFAILTAPMTLVSTAVVGALHALDLFLAPGAIGFLAVAGALVAVLAAGALPFFWAYRLPLSLALTAGFLAELFAGLVSLTVGLIVGITGPVGLIVTLALGFATWYVRDRGETQVRDRLYAEAGKPVAPSIRPPARHAAPSPA